uniref:Putative ovule protein n=1 Tax=Solanum chacoense TaxID=4108 RepID=A0A0V0HAM7_SOLCH
MVLSFPPCLEDLSKNYQSQKREKSFSKTFSNSTIHDFSWFYTTSSFDPHIYKHIYVSRFPRKSR